VRVSRRLLDLLRGALIGVVEVAPGISGGTVALLVGVYDDLIGSAGHLVRGTVGGAADLVRGRGTSRAGRHLKAVSWAVIVPVGIGMVLAVVVASAIVAPLFEDHPVETRALFAGLIVASIAVPARMVGGRWRPREWALAAAAVVVSFVLTGIPSAAPLEPAPVVIALSAAVAVCALVVPGLSGSFVLLTVGMYAPTLAAVNERDLAYLGIFIVGAVLGLASFVSLLQWLLTHRRRVTLSIMTGLMVGSLRALWPWQTETGRALAPADGVVVPLILFVLGMLIVGAVLRAGRPTAARVT
jgi:putative membrane protein